MVDTYSKGQKPRDLDAAQGGPTLERVRSFVKDERVMLGPKNKQDYGKKGKGDGDEKRTGDKSETAIKPRS